MLTGRAAPRWRALGGVVVLVALVLTLGTDGVLAGLAALRPGPIVAALVLGAVATVAAALRWRLIARAVGLELGIGRAVGDYYRASLLNAVLPAGVLGDVHRAIDHGRRSGRLGLGVRAVAVERVLGQVVLVLVAAGAWAIGAGEVLREQFQGVVLGVTGAVVAVVVGLGVLAAWFSGAPHERRGGNGRVVTALRTVGGELRSVGGALPAAVGLSLVAGAAFVALFVVAARAAGVSAPLTTVLPLVLVALLAMAIPLSVGGWGPREGVAAVMFAAAGLGAEAGFATAVAYGLLALISTAPGVVVLLARAGTGVRPRPALAPADNGSNVDAAERVNGPAGPVPARRSKGTV